MDMDGIEDAILEFSSITNAPRDTAISFLEMTGGNIEQAITLYLETRDPNPPTPVRRIPQASVEDAVDPNSTFESDAELARQLAQEGEAEIRAPIAPKREILVANNDFGEYIEPMLGRRFPQRPHRASREQQYRNFAGEVTMNTSDSTEESDRATRLADLYRPPFDIMSKENFERTRNEARNKNKWLMVDIQEASEFSCHQLNSDLWKDNTVKDVIREHFLFLQLDSKSTEGRRYINFYPISNYPHIAIIDPRTGERLKVWNTLVPTDFLIAVTDFLERHSLSETTPKKDEKSMTEQQSDAAFAVSVDHEEDRGSEVDSMEEDPVEESSNNEGMPPVSVFDSIRPVERTQVQGPNATTIKFRLADGKTIIRHFGKTDPVRHLFEYIKVSVPEAQEQPFELVCYSDNLIDKVDQTIEQAGLANAVVNMVFG